MPAANEEPVQATETTPLSACLDDGGLSAAFAALSRRVATLEAAAADGSLASRVADGQAEAMLGRRMAHVYGRLGTLGLVLPTARAAAVRELLAQSRRLLVDPRFSVPATYQFAPRAEFEPDAPPRSPRLIDAAAALGAAPVLRADQVLASRFWRIGLVSSDAPSQRLADQWLLAAVVAWLSREMNRLGKLLVRFRPRYDEASGPVTVVPRPPQRAFEQLVEDILNEHHHRAWSAPLDEDFLEKTDLRVRYPDLARKRGGRVQVTFITHAERHREKVDRIRREGEYVVVSPRTIARFVQAVQVGQEVANAEIRGVLPGFWRSLDSKPADVEALSWALKSVFVDALRRPHHTALGPLRGVPSPIRELVRAFVHFESFRSTAELRAREERSGGVRRAVARGKPKRTWSEEQRLAAAALPLDEPLDGVVEAVKDYGVFVMLAGGVSGLLHRTALHDYDAPETRERLARGKELQVLVRAVSVDQRRITLAEPGGPVVEVPTAESQPGPAACDREAPALPAASTPT